MPLQKENKNIADKITVGEVYDVKIYPFNGIPHRVLDTKGKKVANVEKTNPAKRSILLVFQKFRILQYSHQINIRYSAISYCIPN